uniref:proline-rich proteoglycan 2-like n=1 Tax=Agelaius phoeniceus TaxID=39638 RepID=UPI0023EB8CA1|nr:proline-rich proteoglycan 2-like [Agelaius phoeniceus]
MSLRAKEASTVSSCKQERHSMGELTRCQRPRLRFQSGKRLCADPAQRGPCPRGGAEARAPEGGREGEPRQPPVTGRRQRAGPGRPAAGHPAKLRNAKGAKLWQELLQPLANNPPGPQPCRPSQPRAPPLPHLPGVSAAPPDEPHRAASQSPPAHSQRPAGYRLPHPPPFHEETFPSQLPARPKTRCPPREGGDGTRTGSAARATRTPGTPQGTGPKGAGPGRAEPAAVTPPLTSQAAWHGGTRGGQRPPRGGTG